MNIAESNFRAGLFPIVPLAFTKEVCRDQGTLTYISTFTFSDANEILKRGKIDFGGFRAIPKRQEIRMYFSLKTDWINIQILLDLSDDFYIFHVFSNFNYQTPRLFLRYF